MLSPFVKYCIRSNNFSELLSICKRNPPPAPAQLSPLSNQSGSGNYREAAGGKSAYSASAGSRLAVNLAVAVRYELCVCLFSKQNFLDFPCSQVVSSALVVYAWV